VHTSGAALVGCYSGSYPAIRQYRGDNVSWHTLTIGNDGSLTLSGSNPITIPANDITAAIETDGQVVISHKGTQPAAELILFTNARGLRDIEYTPAGHQPVGVNLQSSPLPTDWVQNPNTIINNGIAAYVDGQLFLLYHDTSDNTVYADERGFNFTGSDASDDSWRIRIDTPKLEINTDYTCQVNTNETSVTLKINGKGIFSSINGGQCRIQLSTIELMADKTLIDYIDGIFIAELPGANRNDAPIIIDGRFRFDVN